ncbi:hypothetical protein HYV44_03690 [Candidatus Microgenomates bacterium]|nr:hypothetical protein [Candidatus Microgenomates bacterium]
MKRYIGTIVLGLFILTIGIFAVPNSASAYVRVKGYSTKRGTYVMPYYKTKSDKKKFNNFSSKGNFNPFTSKKGYKKW